MFVGLLEAIVNFRLIQRSKPCSLMIDVACSSDEKVGLALEDDHRNRSVGIHCRRRRQHGIGGVGKSRHLCVRLAANERCCAGLVGVDDEGTYFFWLTVDVSVNNLDSVLARDQCNIRWMDHGSANHHHHHS